MSRPMLPAEVADIRASHAAGEGVRALAKRLGRSPSHVAAVVEGRLHAEPAPAGSVAEARAAVLDALDRLEEAVRADERYRPGDGPEGER